MNTAIAANRCRWAALPCLLLTASASAAVYTVGPAGTPGNCTHTTIQLAINAAAANPGPDEIRIANNQPWTAQALTISNQSVTLTGGFANCQPLAPTGQTRLSGAGGAQASVLAVANSATSSQEVILSRLEIIDGDATADLGGNINGGGVLWQGPGLLRLERVRIANNRASFGGGGLYLSGQGSHLPLTLTIGTQVQIEDNQTPQGGGGIHLANADLLLAGPDTTIRRNSATSGGGILAYAEGRPQLIDIASGGFGSDGVIAGNSSSHTGGGVNVSGTVELRLYTSDPARPLRLERNAARFGGAISAANGARVNLWEAIVSSNVASDEGAALSLNGASLGAYRVPGPVTPPPTAVACAAPQVCNRWQDNIARNASNQPVNGAIARLVNLVDMPTELRMESAVIRGNQGSSLFRDRCQASSCNLSLRLTSSELVDNPAASFSAFTFNTGAYLDLCTVAGFGAGPSPLFAMSNGILNLSRSIVWQPGRTLLDTPTVLNASFLLLHDTTGFPPDPHIRSDDPRFVDTAAGNWQLAADSPALDSAPAADAPAQDLARASRVVDLPNITNLAGPLDLGAWERQVTDAIFTNGFESPPSAVAGQDR